MFIICLQNVHHFSGKSCYTVFRNKDKHSKVVIKILKTMFQQFVDGGKAIPLSYGLLTKNSRYYQYIDDKKQNLMIVVVTTNLTFYPKDLYNLIVKGMVRIEYLKFSEV